MRGKDDSAMASLVKGEASVVIASIISFPLQRAFVEQMQTKGSFKAAVKEIIRTNSYFRGLSPALARVLITGAVAGEISKLILGKEEKA